MESAPSNTKISDSGYSNSCSNSNSQRSASSKSRISGSNSSGSSGYCGAASTNHRSGDEQAKSNKRIKDKEHKKKNNKLALTSTSLPAVVIPNSVTSEGRPFVSGDNDNADMKMGAETKSMCGNAESTTMNGHSEINNYTNLITTTTVVEISSEEMLTKWVPATDKSCGAIQEPLCTMDTTDGAVDMNCTEQPNNTTDQYQPKNGFCCVISMSDGIVLYTSPGVSDILGFPNDMWLGRSFIDLVHPKDREMFSTQLMSGHIPLTDLLRKETNMKNSVYVRLRKYRGLKTIEYGVVEKIVSYQAFCLTLTFKQANDNNSGTILVVMAIPIYSLYHIPSETRESAKFGMHHTASCTFNYVDSDVVTNFGFLPQDMLGKSIFDFYHPEDMPLLKEVYQSVLKKCRTTGAVFKSKPYRFAAQNGDFVVIETEWSCFVNPWSRKLESVIGLNRVVKGPINSDIFETPTEYNTKRFSQEVMKQNKIIQQEIVSLLNQQLSKPLETTKQQVSKRCTDLATFMKTLINEESKSNLRLDLPQGSDERDLAMLGEISPHTDCYERESSLETPPSYNQLNYNENIQRFFQSKPMTTASDKRVDHSSNQQKPTESDQGIKALCAAQVCNKKYSGTFDSGSAENLSCKSNLNLESGTTSASNTCDESYKPLQLTEELLLKHNEDMEKIMRKKLREHRSIKTEEVKRFCYRNNKIALNKRNKNNQEEFHYQGVKRRGSYSYENNHNVSKCKYQVGTTAELNSRTDIQYNKRPGLNDVNLWPPFSVTVTDVSDAQTVQVNSRPTNVGGFATGVIPVFYFSQQGQNPVDNSDSNFTPTFPVQCMPGMTYNYNQVLPASPVFYSPVPIVPAFPQLLVPTYSETRYNSPGISNQITPERKLSPHCVGSIAERPSSQATSIKVEPGSALGSNRAMSECSRKDLDYLEFPSVCSPDSPLVSPLYSKTDGENFSLYVKANVVKRTDIEKNRFQQNLVVDDGSSFSSSFSSVLKTDTGSNGDSINTENKAEIYKNVWQQPKYCPVRKSDPPWLETVEVTPDLIYRYQVAVKGLEDILQSDLNSLKEINQPSLVNDQLDQLYIQMELEGFSNKLTLYEGTTSNSSSGEEAYSNNVKQQPRKKKRSYSSQMMIYEENAPFPPPSNGNSTYTMLHSN